MNKIPTLRKPTIGGVRAFFSSISWRDLAVSFGPMVLLIGVSIWLAIWLIHPAPPTTLTIATGQKESIFWAIAEKYRQILARDGVTLKLVASEGSLDNLQMLADPNTKVDIAFVQGGVVGGEASEKIDIDGLTSLGSLSYVPVIVFYRHEKPLSRLSELAGKRIAIGIEGSGSRVLALNLLKANGISPAGSTRMLDIGGEEAANALAKGKIDAAFLMGDSASLSTMKQLLRTPGVRLFDFVQASAYVRRFPYLNELTFPIGVFDLARNLPDHTIRMIAPTVELVARQNLHPALSDLLIEAAREVHSKPDIYQKAGEFPAPLAHEYPISDDAVRYYKSGKGFFYRTLPFWLASLLDRTMVIVLPVILLLIPGIKLVPQLYGWRIRSRLYRWYGALIALERGVTSHTPEELKAMFAQLDEIEAAVNRMRMPLAFADQFYVLREHIGFVRSRLQNSTGLSPEGKPVESEARST